jgi:hypothetical protein
VPKNALKINDASHLSPRSPNDTQDWVLASPHSLNDSRPDRSTKVGYSRFSRLLTHPDYLQQSPKTSVRAKTSAFLGKVLGQGIVRERSVRLVCLRRGLD